MNEHYFAYGSNLWIEQMVERIGLIDRGDGWPQCAALPGYRLTFNMEGDDGQVFANLEAADARVLGVVYRCTPEALRIMDGFESGYERRRVKVVSHRGELVDATTYVANPAHTTTANAPSPDYLQRIVRGARQHSLPEAYILEIEKIAQQR